LTAIPGRPALGSTGIRTCAGAAGGALRLKWLPISWRRPIFRSNKTQLSEKCCETATFGAAMVLAPARPVDFAGAAAIIRMVKGSLMSGKRGSRRVGANPHMNTSLIEIRRAKAPDAVALAKAIQKNFEGLGI